MKINLFYFILIGIIFQNCHPPVTPPVETAAKPAKKAGNDTTSLSETQYKLAGIELGTVEKRTLSHVLKVNGTIEISPQQQVSISAPVGGFVRKIGVSSGMKILAGTELAVIENQDFLQMQQDYAETQSRLVYAEAEFKRQTELLQENVTAKKTLELATSEVRTLRARSTAFEQKLLTLGISPAAVKQGVMTNHISLRSPAMGFVTLVNVNAGKFVNPADVLFEIMDTSQPLAELTIFEQDVPGIRAGQVVRLQLSNEQGKERMAVIQAVTPKISAERTVKVKARLAAGNENLFPGTFLKAFIDLDENPVTALPETAVVTFEGKDFIFISRGKQGGNEVFEMLPIQKGITENGFTEVIFAEGTVALQLNIVRKGAYNLLAKLKNAGEE